MKQAIQILFIVLLLSVVSLQVVTLISSRLGTQIVKICPTGAISMRGSKAVIDNEKCIGCQRCVLGVSVRFPQTQPQAVRTPIVTSVADSIPSSPLPSPPQNQTVSTKIKEAAKSVQPQTPQQSETKKAYKVNPDSCIGCQLCVSACPTQAISMVNGKAVIDKVKCINCGICANGDGNDFPGCPVAAIKAP